MKDIRSYNFIIQTEERRLPIEKTILELSEVRSTIRYHYVIRIQHLPRLHRVKLRSNQGDSIIKKPEPPG